MKYTVKILIVRKNIEYVLIKLFQNYIHNKELYILLLCESESYKKLYKYV